MIVSPGMGNKLNNADNNFEGFEQGVSLGAVWLELFYVWAASPIPFIKYARYL